MPRPEASNAGDEDNPTSSESTRGSMIGMRKRKKGRWWQCGPVKVLILAVLGMFVLNYASLKREQRSLMPPGMSVFYFIVSIVKQGIVCSRS